MKIDIATTMEQLDEVIATLWSFRKVLELSDARKNSWISSAVIEISDFNVKEEGGTDEDRNSV